MQRLTPLLLLAALCAGPAPAGEVNDLEQCPPGKLPADVFVLNGAFTIAKADGNTFIELPGDPLDSFGFLFGPEGHALLDVSARISGESRGKMFPEFGVGANDAGGYKLWLMPGQRKLALRKGDAEKAVVAYDAWKSGEWTTLRLRLTPAGEGKWKIEGKAWPASAKEPDQWTISAEETTPPTPRRASASGHP